MPSLRHVYLILKDHPKNVINRLKIRQLMHVIVQGMIREGPQIPLGCQAFLAPLGKYARHADNRGPSSEPCMPSVPGIPVAPLQVCLALNRTYLPIMDGMHITICTLFTGLYDSCIPIVEMSGICQYINVFMDICMYGYIHLETVFPCPSASSPDQGQGTPFGSGSAFPSPSSVSSLGTPFTFHFRLGNLTSSGSDFLNVHLCLAINGVFECS